MSEKAAPSPDMLFTAVRLAALGTALGLMLLLPAALGIRSGLLAADREALWLLLVQIVSGLASGLLCRKQGNRGWLTCIAGGAFALLLRIVLQAFLPGCGLSVTGAALPAAVLTVCWFLTLAAGGRKRENDRFH